MAEVVEGVFGASQNQAVAEPRSILNPLRVSEMLATVMTSDPQPGRCAGLIMRVMRQTDLRASDAISSWIGRFKPISEWLFLPECDKLPLATSGSDASIVGLTGCRR
ncbi:hypothetical protein [Bradyrhizobium sp. HKCCYLR20261]|uniref:hypothetical protein n=1 Tax=Bradyrhizobium sp. HKCCYLR20261 TaxID=3420760 RepID=UPI003EB95FD4